MRLRLVTLNVWALPGPLGQYVNTRMSAIGEGLATLDADVVALQEVWTLPARRGLVDAGRRAGLVHAWHNEATIGGGGLLVLSKLPVLTARFQRFAIRGLPQQPHHIDYFGGKGFVALEMAAGQRPFTLIATHLHARYGSDVDHEYRAHRTAQVVEVAQAVHGCQGPVVVCGDFNFEESDDEHAVLTGLSGLSDVAAQLGRRQPTLLGRNPYRRGAPRDRRVDLIFTRHGRETRAVPRSVARVFDEPIPVGGRRGAHSDHSGLLAEVEFVPGPPQPLPAVDATAVEMASRRLSEGRRAAERRRRGGRLWAGAGLGGALLVTAGMRAPHLTRRRLLRASLAGVGAIALTPGLALSVLSEVYVPEEIQAFSATAERLASLAEDRAEDARVAHGPDSGPPG